MSKGDKEGHLMNIFNYMLRWYYFKEY